jgi:alkane 1-monooxygenase
MNGLAYGLFHLFPVATVLGTCWGGPWAFLAPLLAGVAVPVADAWLGDDERNPGPDDEAGILAKRRWRAPLYAFVPLQVGALAWACWWAAAHPPDLAGWTALVLAVGVVNGGLAINVAHELCHRAERLDQALAKTLWTTVGYLHFHVEHRLGHHAHVATPADPATARLGEPIYAFWPRSVWGGFRSAWRIEAARLQALGLPRLSGRNQVLWAVLLPPAIAAALHAAWGPAAAALYVMQALAAILVLETVNYVEHYGLQRRLVAPGVYEKVGVAHSWNSHRRLTNWLLIGLQRHSDHHANPGRRYPVLRAFADAPMLPTGYGGMVLLALVPPLWHRVMDPRAIAVRERHGLAVTIPQAEVRREEAAQPT